ncbi:hypothetical protein WDW89_24605 [Deltaproteobacteria bacterium TL4]
MFLSGEICPACGLVLQRRLEDRKRSTPLVLENHAESHEATHEETGQKSAEAVGAKRLP